jgi:hypothetical protein
MSRVKVDEQFARLLEVSSPVAAAADPTLGVMANIANALRATANPAPPGPDPVFRAELRQRLVAVATVQAAEPALARARSHAGAVSTVTSRAQRRIAALAGTIAIATSLAGVGVAAARSLPGDPFYGVKRATEAVQLWTARGDLSKGKRHLEFARTRLAEAQALPQNSSHLASTLAAMNAQTTSGSTELITAYKASKSPQALTDLVMFSHQQLIGLVKLGATLPTAVRRQELGSIGVLVGVVKQVHTVANGLCVLCGTSGGATPGSHPTTPPTPSAHPSSNPPTTTLPTRSAHPSSNPPTRSGSSSKPHPSHTPLIPLPTISSILHLHHHHKHPLPTVSTLLKGLGL